jgi:hypothetical protein
VVVTKKSDLKMVRYFLVAGFLVPCLLYLAFQTGAITPESSWILACWPTLPLIMTAEAAPGAAGLAIAFLISAAANVAIYGLVGAVASFGYRRYSYAKNKAQC